MSHRPSLTACALAAALAFAAACRGGPDPGEGSAPDAVFPPTSPDELERQVRVFVMESREVAGFLRLVLELESRADDPLDLAWGVEWLDRAGAPLALAVTQWRRVRLEPGRRLAVEASAPAAGAASWRLRVADPDSVPLVRDASSETPRGSR
jgi:hypothetical protein